MRGFRDLHRHLGRDEGDRERSNHTRSPQPTRRPLSNLRRPLKREGGQAHQQAHDDGIKHPGQHLSLPRVRLAFQKLAHVQDLLFAEPLIRNQMDEEQFGRSLEELACQVP